MRRFHYEVNMSICVVFIFFFGRGGGGGLWNWAKLIVCFQNEGHFKERLIWPDEVVSQTKKFILEPFLKANKIMQQNGNSTVQCFMTSWRQRLTTHLRPWIFLRQGRKLPPCSAVVPMEMFPKTLLFSNASALFLFTSSKLLSLN